MDNANLYYQSHPEWLTMKVHDCTENALERWFDNYKIDETAKFASMYEWLVVEEVEATARHIKKRYVCSIGDDYLETRRDVAIDHTAPPPPLLTFAARMKREPVPQKSFAELRREAEWNRRRDHDSFSVVDRFAALMDKEISAALYYGIDMASGEISPTGRRQRPPETQQLPPPDTGSSLTVDDLVRAMDAMKKNDRLSPSYYDLSFNPVFPSRLTIEPAYAYYRHKPLTDETVVVPKRKKVIIRSNRKK